MFDDDALPDILPESPLPLARQWLDEAIREHKTPNPNAIALATSDEQGNPSCRFVLLKHLDHEAGYLVFYTNYDSRKGRELAARPRAAATLLMDHQERQIRFEGPVLTSPSEESDAYFASRPLISRVGSAASAQSSPIASREDMLQRVQETMARLGITPADLLQNRDIPVPRPSNWGGFRLWFDRVELWVGGKGRVHDRAVWTRTLEPADGSFRASPWAGTRLQP